MRNALKASVLLLSAILPSVLPAQESKKLSFDSASIRQNIDGHGKCQPEQTLPAPTGLQMTNCPLLVALAAAYVPADGSNPLGFVLADRLIHAPEWLLHDRYDLQAHIADADLAQWQNQAERTKMFRAMMQSLLAERCKLIVHREMRERSVYVLVIDKKGSKLKPSANDRLEDLRASHPNATEIPGGGGLIEKGGTEIYHASMGTLALLLADMLEQPVIDQTGLTGRYDIKMESLNKKPIDGGEGGSTIFSEMPEVLGLRLESRKDKVEVLVIDHVEAPSAN